MEVLVLTSGIRPESFESSIEIFLNSLSQDFQLNHDNYLI
jgi:hypothetical protein